MLRIFLWTLTLLLANGVSAALHTQPHSVLCQRALRDYARVVLEGPLVTRVAHTAFNYGVAIGQNVPKVEIEPEEEFSLALRYTQLQQNLEEIRERLGRSDPGSAEAVQLRSEWHVLHDQLENAGARLWPRPPAGLQHAPDRHRLLDLEGVLQLELVPNGNLGLFEDGPRYLMSLHLRAFRKISDARTRRTYLQSDGLSQASLAWLYRALRYTPSQQSRHHEDAEGSVHYVEFEMNVRPIQNEESLPDPFQDCRRGKFILGRVNTWQRPDQFTYVLQWHPR